MTITRADVADLREGDVVRFRNSKWPEGASITGPVYRTETLDLQVGGHPLLTMSVCGTLAEFEVVSRAPRPLYINHDRTEPVPGDVVRNADDDGPCAWVFDDPSDQIEPWRHTAQVACKRHRTRWVEPRHMPDRLRLLVDGHTGMAVPS